MHRIKKFGLTPDQYIALRWIHEFPEGEISQVKLAGLMFTDSNNIAGLIKRMEEQNLIVRKANTSDLRKKFIFQSEYGSSQFKKGKKIAEQLEGEALSCFSSREKKHFLSLLKELSMTINDRRKTLFF